MDLNKIIFLPGLDKQLNYFLDKVDIKEKSILIVGSNTGEIARRVMNEAREVIIIVDDHEDLISMRLALSEGEQTVRYMEYSNTDFINKRFDIIYAQGSVSRGDRNKILKEFKKILSANGILCIGEVVSLTENPPQFVKDTWNQSYLAPVNISEIENYYEERGFKVFDTKDLTYTLKKFYSLAKKSLQEGIIELPEKERKIYKKILNRMQHESDVYLKLGGDRHIGFKSLLLKYSTS